MSFLNYLAKALKLAFFLSYRVYFDCNIYVFLIYNSSYIKICVFNHRHRFYEVVPLPHIKTNSICTVAIYQTIPLVM